MDVRWSSGPHGSAAARRRGSCYQAQKAGINCGADAGAVYVSRSRCSGAGAERRTSRRPTRAAGTSSATRRAATEDGVVVVGAIGEASGTTDAVPGPGPPNPSGQYVLPSCAPPTTAATSGNNCCTAPARSRLQRDGRSWASTAYLKSPARAQSDYATDPITSAKVSIESGEITVDAVGNSPNRRTPSGRRSRHRTAGRRPAGQPTRRPPSRRPPIRPPLPAATPAQMMAAMATPPSRRPNRRPPPASRPTSRTTMPMPTRRRSARSPAAPPAASPRS